MRRALLLLPVILVVAALAALRACADDTVEPRGSERVEATGTTAGVDDVPPLAQPRRDERRRVSAAPAAVVAEPKTTAAALDALPRLRGRVVSAAGHPLRRLRVRIAESSVPAATSPPPAAWCSTGCSEAGRCSTRSR